MSLPKSVADVLHEHVKLKVECIDRMYLNVYVPRLQRESGIAWFFRSHRGQRFPSSALMAPMSETFVASIERFAKENNVPLIRFEKGQRKDDIALEQLAKFKGTEGVLFIGKAQEKARVFRTEKRRNEKTGRPYPWLVPSSAMVNQYYNYCVDEDFGPFFLKFCSYFPYNAKLCINGHEYVKRQLDKEGIAYQALDNGIHWCEAPERLQQICDDLSPEKIDRLLRKWLARLPHPFLPGDRAAGYRYDISILQAEFAQTLILDRPLSARIFLEEVIRENLDLGRPENVQLIFNRRVTKRTPGTFRTRIITEGVTPTIHAHYKSSKIKQYHKHEDSLEGRRDGLRSECTINNTRDFGVGRRLENLPKLREIGFAANRRLLEMETVSHDCLIGEETLARLQKPVQTQGQRVAGMPLHDKKVQALLAVIVMLCTIAHGFSNREIRELFAQLLGVPTGDITQGMMTYHLRRMKHHGIIERIPKKHRYRVTREGLRIALFCNRAYIRLFRPGLSIVMPTAPPNESKLRRAFDNLDDAMNDWCDAARLAA